MRARTEDQAYGRRLEVGDRFAHDGGVAEVVRVNDCAAYVVVRGGVRRVDLPKREEYVRGRGWVTREARSFDAREVSGVIAVSRRSVVRLLPDLADVVEAGIREQIGNTK